MNRLELYAIAAIALAIAMAGAYFKGHSDGADRVQVKWDTAVADQRDKEQKQANVAVTKLESSNDKAKVVYRTITQSVDKLVDRPVYTNICLDPDGVRIANQALTGTLAAPAKPDLTVPRSATTVRWDGCCSPEKTGRGQ